VFTINEINDFADAIKSQQIRRTVIHDIFYLYDGTDIEIIIKIPPFLNSDVTKLLNEIDFHTFFRNRINDNHICGTYYISNYSYTTGMRAEKDGTQSYWIHSYDNAWQAFGMFICGGDTFYTYIEGSYDGCPTCGCLFGREPNYKLIFNISTRLEDLIRFSLTEDEFKCLSQMIKKRDNSYKKKKEGKKIKIVDDEGFTLVTKYNKVGK
jgi:hypothetical protein